MKAINAIIILLMVANFAAGAYFYSAMPNFMASHWNAWGEVDGYMEKDFALFLLPSIILAIAGFLYLVPRIDPLRENIEKFQRQYDGFIFLFVLFLSYVYFLQIAWSLGLSFDMNRMMVPGLGVLFIYIGTLCRDCKQNWFVGVRTPWTLSSERVWDKTHTLAEKLFVWIGLLWIVVGLLFPGFSPFMIAAVILAAISLFAYSYIEFRNEKNEQKGLPQKPPGPLEVKVISAPHARAAARPTRSARVSRPMPRKRPHPIPLKKKPSRRPKRPERPERESRGRKNRGRRKKR